MPQSCALYANCTPNSGCSSGQDCQVCLVNYKRDGTLFYNQFFIAPLRGKDSHIVENFIGVQCPVSKEQFDIFQKSQFEHDQKAEAERKKSGPGSGLGLS